MKSNLLNIVLFIAVTVAGISCDNTSSTDTPLLLGSNHNLLLRHHNLIIYSYSDDDELLYVVCCDDNREFCDTVSLGYNGNLPDILLKDLNNDDINDVLVIFDFSNTITLIRYWGYFSDKDAKMVKPKINYQNQIVDFFTSNDIANYNLRILPENTLMFQYWYLEMSFYGVQQNEIVPLAKVKRTDGDFEGEAVWDSERNKWGEYALVKDSSRWLKLTKQHWEKSFVGEY